MEHNIFFSGLKQNKNRAQHQNIYNDFPVFFAHKVLSQPGRLPMKAPRFRSTAFIFPVLPLSESLALLFHC